MAGVTEIRARIKSVEQTLKITNAMYLISSSKLKKARAQLDEVFPYFQKISTTIADILRHSPELDHPYFQKRAHPDGPHIGYIVVTGDKGLAGAYNHNILKMAEELIAKDPNATLFVVGQVGRHYFRRKKINMDGEFLYAAQDPTIFRAREMSETVMELFGKGHLDEVNILYTQMLTPLTMEPRLQRLLPLEPEEMKEKNKHQERYREVLSYVPSVEAVLDNLVPGMVKGIIFGALVEAFCSEQNARMTAMDSATKNAKDMIRALSLVYNRARQAAITQEITEIVGGAEGLK